MALEKYKVCPGCGEHNPPSLLECRKCETDLTGVKVIDDTAADESITTAEPDASTEAAVRICECGAHNPPQARKCSVCGEDISDILPTRPAKGSVEASGYQLQAVAEDFCFVPQKPVVVLGRDAEPKEYLKDKVYTSRTHAKLTAIAGKVFIENLSKTNGTFVNNLRLPDDTPVQLHSDDEIGLGGKVVDGSRQEQAAYFIFKETP